MQGNSLRGRDEKSRQIYIAPEHLPIELSEHYSAEEIFRLYVTCVLRALGLASVEDSADYLQTRQKETIHSILLDSGATKVSDDGILDREFFLDEAAVPYVDYHPDTNLVISLTLLILSCGIAHALLRSSAMKEV